MTSAYESSRSAIGDTMSKKIAMLITETPICVRAPRLIRVGRIRSAMMLAMPQMNIMSRREMCPMRSRTNAENPFIGTEISWSDIDT